MGSEKAGEKRLFSALWFPGPRRDSTAWETVIQPCPFLRGGREAGWGPLSPGGRSESGLLLRAPPATRATLWQKEHPLHLCTLGLGGQANSRALPSRGACGVSGGLGRLGEGWGRMWKSHPFVKRKVEVRATLPTIIVLFYIFKL